jgi:quercetin dioxygenase-like cupin family protein
MADHATASQPTIGADERMNERGRAVKAHRKRILTVIASIGALVVAALIIVPAQATPSSGVTTTILAKSVFDDIHVNARTHTPASWKAKLKTHGDSDVYVVDNKFAPGATAGWHSHPGPSLILVVAGTVTNYEGDDPTCTPHTYSAGDGFVDPGSGQVHLLRNETHAPAETIAVQLLAQGAERRIDVPVAPSNCPF